MNDTGNEGGAIVERIERPAPAEAFGAFLMQALADPNISAEKLKLILDARGASLAAEAKEAFEIAFAQFAAELPPVEKDGWVELGQGKGRYPFLSYEQMDSVLRPLLSKYGLALSFSSVDNKDSVTITGALVGHGWERTSTYSFPPDAGPGRNQLQARGSARTYAKRYIADDLCNVVRKGRDNDGRGAIEELIDATQIKELSDLIKATNTVEATFLKTDGFGCRNLEQIRERDYPRLVMALREKQRKTKK